MTSNEEKVPQNNGNQESELSTHPTVNDVSTDLSIHPFVGYAPSFQIQPEKFSGDPGSVLVQDWLVRFERIAEANGWSKDRYVVMAKVCLIGYASDWLEELPSQLKNTVDFDLFSKLMIEEFTPEQSHRKNKEKLKNLKLDLGGLKQYKTRFKALLRQTKIVEESKKIKYFLRGLPMDIASRIYEENCEKLEAVITSAQKKLEAMEHAREAHGVVPQDREFEVLKARVNVLDSRQRKRLTPEERACCIREGRCFYCREQGHLLPECPAISQQGNL